MASLSTALLALSFIRFIRQNFRLAVRFMPDQLARLSRQALVACRPEIPYHSKGFCRADSANPLISRALPRIWQVPAATRGAEIDFTLHPRTDGPRLERCEQIRQVARRRTSRHGNARGSRT